jgi:hypothetical protein
MDLFGHLRVNFDYGVQFNGHNECEINNNNKKKTIIAFCLYMRQCVMNYNSKAVILPFITTQKKSNEMVIRDKLVFFYIGIIYHCYIDQD